MNANNYTDKSFGEQIGRSRLQVLKYRHGKAIPGKSTMQRILEVSAGQVTAASFYTSQSVVGGQ
jgi:transcriptional regulator with XRE-family HTH domain